MKQTKMIQELVLALAYVQDGNGIYLGDDVFLCEGGHDGSDKIYGFKRVDGELYVESRGASDGYPIDNMVKSDLKHMFNESPISDKIKAMKYRAVPLDANGQLDDNQTEVEQTLYKTVIQVEVLSDEPFDGGDLETIHEAIHTGHCSGLISDISRNEKIIGQAAALEVTKHGTDHEFFNMDSNGFVSEEEI